MVAGHKADNVRTRQPKEEEDQADRRLGRQRLDTIISWLHVFHYEIIRMKENTR